MANQLISSLIGVFLIGLIWAALYDTVNADIPNQNPVGPSERPNTWYVMSWLWNAFVPLVCLSLGIASLSKKGSYVGSTIGFASLVFVSWTLLIIMWLVLFSPLNHTIPDAFYTFSGTFPPTYVSSFFDNGILLIMCGMGAVMLVRST